MKHSYLRRWGMEKLEKLGIRREEYRRKYSKMDERVKDNLVRLFRKNGGG